MFIGQLIFPRRGYRPYLRRGSGSLAVLLLVYYALAYHTVPALWRHHYRKHPALIDAPKVTHTKDGIPGDPLNVALVGTRLQVEQAMLAAGWDRVDPRTFGTSVRITTSVATGRQYRQAPVSDLFLWGRCQDLAFQQAVGRSAKKRHHVRFWQAPELDADGRPLWLGAATFDCSVGLAGYTFQVTHHIDGDIDAERDKILNDLQRSKQLVDEYRVVGLGPTQNGRNGGRDRYFTDGDIRTGVLVAAGMLVAKE